MLNKNVLPSLANLAKEGVDAPSRNIPVPLIGADGVVRSNSKTISLERTTPSAPVTVASRSRASRYFLNGRSHPSFPKEGNSLQTLNFRNNQMRIPPRAKARDYTHACTPGVLNSSISGGLHLV